MTNAIVYRCVRMIAEAAASVPWLLYEGAQEIETHPLLALLAAPNPQQSGAELFERWYAFLQCAGNAYLEGVTLRGDVRELYTLRPDRVQIVAGSRGWPVAYDYTVDQQTIRLSRDPLTGFLPVLHSTLFHPLDDLLRIFAHRSGGDGHRRSQCGREMDEIAARQCGTALRRTDL